MEHHGQICPTPRVADFPESSTAQKRKEPASAEGEVAPMTTATNTDTVRRRGKTPAGRIMLRDHSSNPVEVEQPPAKRQRSSDRKGSGSIKAEYRPSISAAADGRVYQQEGRIKVNIKDLKPKRIKDYLKYKKQPNESESAEKICPGRTRCLLLRHPLCHPVQADYRSPLIKKVEASTINPEATID
ncbi:hypothetical protein GQ457_11G021850 [Hibiscus cannabinus]